MGEYTLLFAEMTAGKQYGEQKIPVFLLAKGKQILTADGQHLTLDAQDYIAHPDGRSYPEIVEFHWEQGGGCIHLSLRSPTVLEETSLMLSLAPWKRRLTLLVANPYYFRFQSELDLEICLGDVQVNEKGKAQYELMLLK